MKNKLLLVVLFASSLLSCGTGSIPQPTYHEGWEQLLIKRLEWNGECFNPYGRPKLFQDLAQMRSYQCAKGFDSFDFDQYNVLIYFQAYDQITALRTGSYVYINHRLKKVRLEVVDRTTPNRSGLTTVGFTEVARHVLQIPKIPAGYSIEVTTR